MPISPRYSLYVIALLSSVFLLISFAGILLALKYKRYRSRPYLVSCCFFLLQAIGLGTSITTTMLNGLGDEPFDTVLNPAHLIIGFVSLVFYLAYLVEIKRPGKLNIKTVLLSISPFIIVSAAMILIHPRQLHSWGEVFNNIKNPDVWLRLTIIILYFAYPIFAICQPYNWHQCLIPRKMMTVLQILSIITVPAFITGMLSCYFPAIIINYFLAVTADILVLYIEFRIRIPVTESQEEPAMSEQNCESVFADPKIWMNPDMTSSELVSIIGTNRTYLLDKIKDLGYSSYSDMINRKRVEFICKELKTRKGVSIVNLMFEAGFRSRSTASREFKRIVGCAPSEYQESVTQADKKSRPEN